MEETYDVVVVGGGIIGAGVARDAAMRGLTVALFEREDFACGTTSGSTRLIHGGLRYLEMLDFRLVRMDLREREILLKIAPHLVKPLEFLVPFYRRSLFYRLKLRLGMLLYDALSFDKSLPNHRVLSAPEVLSEEPSLDARGLQGATLYYDAQVNSPERLCLENILDARRHGAFTANYSAVTGLLRDQGKLSGVRVRDTLRNREMEVRARIVVNATGPWLDRVGRTLAPEWNGRLRTTKGVHLTCPPRTRRAIVLFSKLDGRLFFAMPWLNYTWIGTTDTEFSDDPADARATGQDIAYLLESAAEFLPAPGADEIHFTTAGVRALVRRKGAESSVSRAHRILDGTHDGIPGMISILGGKITGYRAIAEETTDLVCRTLGRGSACRTAESPLPGAVNSKEVPSSDLPGHTVDHLYAVYGSLAAEILKMACDPNLRHRLAPAYPDIAAQVVYAVRQEQCARVSDFLLRRSHLGFSPDQGREAIQSVAAIMARELEWSADKRDSEVQEYMQHIHRTQEFRRELAEITHHRTA